MAYLPDYAISRKEACKVAGVCSHTITTWINSGFLHVVENWGNERGDHFSLREVLECSKTQRYAEHNGSLRHDTGTERYQRKLGQNRFYKLFWTEEQKERKREKDRIRGRYRRKFPTEREKAQKRKDARNRYLKLKKLKAKEFRRRRRVIKAIAKSAGLGCGRLARDRMSPRHKKAVRRLAKDRNHGSKAPRNTLGRKSR